MIEGLIKWASALSDKEVVSYLGIGMIVNGLFVAPILTYIMPAYYGRYSGKSWFSISAKLSWLVQECPAFFVPLYYLLTNPALELPNKMLLGMMILHYFQRSFIYALMQRSKNNVAISITFFAFVFCLYNGFMQGVALSSVYKYPSNWLSSPQFILGSVLFSFGFFGNIHSDSILRNLRKPGESGYKIPRGGVFEYVSAANYFCEALEWTGFAIASWNFPAAAFATYTLANLLPRGLSHHQWYKNKFDDYPKNRKAFIPFLL